MEGCTGDVHFDVDVDALLMLIHFFSLWALLHNFLWNAEDTLIFVSLEIAITPNDAAEVRHFKSSREACYTFKWTVKHDPTHPRKWVNKIQSRSDEKCRWTPEAWGNSAWIVRLNKSLHVRISSQLGLRILTQSNQLKAYCWLNSQICIFMFSQLHLVHKSKYQIYHIHDSLSIISGNIGIKPFSVLQTWSILRTGYKYLDSLLSCTYCILMRTCPDCIGQITLCCASQWKKKKKKRWLFHYCYIQLLSMKCFVSSHKYIVMKHQVRWCTWTSMWAVDSKWGRCVRKYFRLWHNQTKLNEMKSSDQSRKKTKHFSIKCK